MVAQVTRTDVALAQFAIEYPEDVPVGALRSVFAGG